MIGGFEQPSEGEVLIAGNVANGVPAYRRPVNMVFQQYALFPHFDVEQNVAYGLKQLRPRLPAAEIPRRVGEALEMVRLSGFSKRRIHEMSGGQQQRVALARAHRQPPRVLLLDEPLAALDKKLRIAMQLELQNLQRELGITFLLVTHDQEEALSMSDQVCVMSAGRIVQLASPQDIYDNPAEPVCRRFRRQDQSPRRRGRTARWVRGGALRQRSRPAAFASWTSRSANPSSRIRPEAIALQSRDTCLDTSRRRGHPSDLSRLVGRVFCRRPRPRRSPRLCRPGAPGRQSATTSSSRARGSELTISIPPSPHVFLVMTQPVTDNKGNSVMTTNDKPLTQCPFRPTNSCATSAVR
jgi:ABC-type Fe3+/spermidine/putrescine transport system ATPase subunit